MQKIKSKRKSCLNTVVMSTLLVFLFFPKIAQAQFDIPPIPDFQTSVYDYIGLLDSSEKNTLEKNLIKYSDSTSTQIVVVIISSTKGENIRYLGARWLEKWGIGDAEKDNGILITLAKDDRKVDINTGYGIEHLLTDALSKRIIESEMIPRFKSNNFYDGLNAGTKAIFEVLKGSYKGTRKSNSNNNFPIGAFIPIIIFFIIILIALSKGKRGGNGGSGGRRSGGFDIWDAIILSNMGRGSTGGGWSSGGSSWGGGSGGFGGGFGGGMGGGGGASGGW